MSTYKAGFIGIGNMGGALAGSACRCAEKNRVAVSGRTPEKVAAFASENGCVASSNEDIALNAEYIFLGVKPQMMGGVLEKISPVLNARTDSFTLVSMAAGISCRTIRELCNAEFPVIRIMPNTPVSVGEGTVLYCCTDNVTKDMTDGFLKLLTTAGELVAIDEKLIDAASALSGCGPAFVYMFIEALADGAVECGLPRKQALQFARQTVLGASKLAIETGRSMGELKDDVCSPGGSTIAGVHALESGAFRACAMDAVRASYERTKELGKK